jgi:membrane protein implicated in regulation of membrane protease activity
MSTYFQFTGIQVVFAHCVLIGGILFIVRLILLFLGMGDHGIDHSSLDPTDIDHSDVDHNHANSDAAFKLLSFQGMMAFLLVFGLIGLAASKSSKMSDAFSCIIACFAGLLMVWLLNKMFKMFSRLQHAGNINLANAVGQVATVYLTISPDQAGQVTVPIQGRMMTVSAIPFETTTFPTGTQVHVRAIVGNGMLVVEPLQ